MSLDREELTHLLQRVQSGTVSRRQVFELGGEAHDIARLTRRRELSAVYPGVYVDHTGELSWTQRAWCAVHTYWPSALARESALPQPDRLAPLHVAIDVGRTVRRLPRIIVHRTPDFVSRVQWVKTPPRISPDHAIIDVMGSAAVDHAYQALATLCQTRITTPAAIRRTLASRPRVVGRALIAHFLDDLETGACSVLERGYTRRVERPHGLPPAQRQVAFAPGARVGYHDVKYPRFGLVVELDGRAFHNTVEGWNHS